MPAQTIRKILNRDFILAFCAQFAFTFVFHSLVPTLPIYLSRLGSAEVEVGVLMGAFSISSLVLRPFVGRALLKVSEKSFMLVGALLFAITSAAYLLAPPFWPFLIVRVFQGIGFALFHTASFILIANISSEAHRGQSLSYFYLATNISGTLAPSLGIFLINRFGFTFLFLVCSGLSLCSLFITNRVRKQQVAPLKDPSTEDSSFFSRKALPPSIINAFSLFTWGALATFFPIYAISRGVANPGFFLTTIALMLILGRGFGGKILDHYSREKIILPCLAICIVGMVVLTFSKTLPMFILVAAIWGIGYAFLTPSLVAYTFDRAGASRGPAMGTFTGISDLGFSLGPVMMGIIIHWAGYPIMFLCLALTGIINFNYFYFFMKKKV